MKNVRNIKGPRDFKGVRIRGDYTWLEGATINEFVDVGKEPNQAEPPHSDTVWKVRGIVKSGLQIMQYTKLVQKPKPKYFVV